MLHIRYTHTQLMGEPGPAGISLLQKHRQALAKNISKQASSMRISRPKHLQSHLPCFRHFTAHLATVESALLKFQGMSIPVPISRSTRTHLLCVNLGILPKLRNPLIAIFNHTLSHANRVVHLFRFRLSDSFLSRRSSRCWRRLRR